METENASTNARPLHNRYQIIALPTEPDRGAEYCDERVCRYMRVCLSIRDHIFGTTSPIFTKFFVPVTYGLFPSVL